MSWLPGWKNRVKLTIDSSKVDEDLTNFPVLITLSSGCGISSADVTDIFTELTYSDRKKIAVTVVSGTSENYCYTEIEKWDQLNQQAWFWTKVPTIASGTDTTLYLYYDSNQLDNSSYIGDTGDTPAQNVWSNSYLAVYHMAQDPNGDVSNAIKDSTSNSSHGTPHGSMTSDDLISGQVGNAIDFDGSDDYIELPAAVNPASNDFTITSIGRGGYTNELYAQSNTGNDGNFIRVCLGYAHLRDDRSSGSWINVIANAGSAGSSWEHVALTFDLSAGAARLFQDGSFSASDSDGNFRDMTPDNYRIACYLDNGVPAYKNVDVNELRISDVIRSDAWIKSDYYSAFDALITYEPYSGYLDGYVYEQGSPVVRKLYLYNRDEGILLNDTTSSGNGYYYMTTTYSGAHCIVCLDDNAGADYNDLIIGKAVPTSIT